MEHARIQRSPSCRHNKMIFKAAAAGRITYAQVTNRLAERQILLIEQIVPQPRRWVDTLYRPFVTTKFT